MTHDQMKIFNKKINILYDHERGLNDSELATKYKLSNSMIRVHIKLAKENFRIIQSVKMRLENDLKKERESYL